MVMSK